MSEAMDCQNVISLTHQPHLNAVLLPGGGPEEGGGDPGEAAGDHAPATSVLAHSLAVVADKTRTTEISLKVILFLCISLL